MKQRRGYILYIGICVLLLFPLCGIRAVVPQRFVVVIDAGHGGHDPGAVGKLSKEKNINLSVALRLGELIERGCPDVKVVYTRKSDVFIPLARRAEIANEAKADLFISVHTNSLANNHTHKGASTWTLGLAKSDANLDVAKRENAVILYEDDYKTRYAGFNPNSSESYIIFEFMQDKYMSQSVHLASLVQKEFGQTCRRIDRGVHQAGFLVLKASAMPSILVELGFISTPEEERYLNSKAGVASLANGIYRAFRTYKEEQESRTQVAAAGDAPSSATVGPGKAGSQDPEADGEGGLVFKVQILASVEPVGKNDRRLARLKGLDCYRENGWYKYTCGASQDYNEIARLRRRLSKDFADAFIVAFRGGRKVDVKEAIAEFEGRNK